MKIDLTAEEISTLLDVLALAQEDIAGVDDEGDIEEKLRLALAEETP